MLSKTNKSGFNKITTKLLFPMFTSLRPKSKINNRQAQKIQERLQTGNWFERSLQVTASQCIDGRQYFVSLFQQ